MCGAVRFTLRDCPERFGACHCEMCRRWSGSALLALSVPRAQCEISGEDVIETIQSSSWAERAWCGKCGSNLWYRVTLDAQPDTLEISLGLLDDTDGMRFEREIFIDCKSDAFAYDGSRNRLTRAEVIEKYNPPI